jgi:hypothetical protein
MRGTTETLDSSIPAGSTYFFVCGTQTTLSSEDETESVSDVAWNRWCPWTICGQSGAAGRRCGPCMAICRTTRYFHPPPTTDSAESDPHHYWDRSYPDASFAKRPTYKALT